MPDARDEMIAALLERARAKKWHLRININADDTLSTEPPELLLQIAHLIIAQQPELTDDEKRSIFGSEQQEGVSQHIWLRLDDEEMSALSDDSGWSWSRQDALKLAYEIIKKYGAPNGT